MNPNQMVNMVIRMVMRRVIGRGVSLGMDAIERKMGKGQSEQKHDMEPERRETMKRAKQSMRTTRRF